MSVPSPSPWLCAKVSSHWFSLESQQYHSWTSPNLIDATRFEHPIWQMAVRQAFSHPRSSIFWVMKNEKFPISKVLIIYYSYVQHVVALFCCTVQFEDPYFWQPLVLPCDSRRVHTVASSISVTWSQPLRTVVSLSHNEHFFSSCLHFFFLFYEKNKVFVRRDNRVWH